MERVKSRLVLMMVAMGMAACTTPPPPDDVGAASAAEKADEAPTAAVPALTPQPDGTPLPRRDPRIAERWPPEIKQLVDNMLTLFPKSPGERIPTVKEVEKKMGITVTERTLKDGETLMWSKRYVMSGTRYMDPPNTMNSGLGEFYGITRDDRPGGSSQHLQLVISPSRSGYCLDPYELAVYTGSTFVNTDNSPHAVIRHWSPAYLWGMFTWSNTGRYGGEGFTIIVGVGRDPATRKIIRAGCVNAMAVAGRFQGEE